MHATYNAHAHSYVALLGVAIRMIQDADMKGVPCVFPDAVLDAITEYANQVLDSARDSNPACDGIDIVPSSYRGGILVIGETDAMSPKCFNLTLAAFPAIDKGFPTMKLTPGDIREFLLSGLLDTCCEQNHRFSKASALALRPVRCLFDPKTHERIEQSGYDCSGILIF